MAYLFFLTLLRNGKIVIFDENGAKKFFCRSTKKMFGVGGLKVGR